MKPRRAVLRRAALHLGDEMMDHIRATSRDLGSSCSCSTTFDSFAPCGAQRALTIPLLQNHAETE